MMAKVRKRYKCVDASNSPFILGKLYSGYVGPKGWLHIFGVQGKWSQHRFVEVE